MEQLIIPSTHSAAYTNIPVAFRSDNATNANFKYVINICWNAHSIVSMITDQLDGNIVTRVNVVAHNYIKGDKIFIFGSSYEGYYNVLSVVDANNIIIDLELQAPYVSGSFTCRYYNYLMPQDPQGIVKLDLANTLKDFVSSTLKDNDFMSDLIGIYDGSSTRFEYFIVLGEQYKYELRFEDNGNISGGLGFYNTSITSLTGIPFKIGDKIYVKQDLFEWSYTSTANESGRVRLNSSNSHNWEVADLVTVTGQSTQPSYNGLAAVFSVPNSTSIVIDKPFIGATAISGIAFGIPKPEYNRDFTITNIYIDGTLGLVIETDGAFTGSSQAIPGTITYLYDTIVSTYTTDVITAGESTLFATFDARIDRKDFRSYGPYYKDMFKDSFTLYGGFGMSTILDSQAQLAYLGTVKKASRIDLATKSFILMHSSTSMTSISIKYNWYDREGGTLLGTSYLDSTLDVKDIYVPVGVVQLLANADRTDSVGFDLADVYYNIKYYEVVPYDGVPDNELANPLKFNVDCCGTIDNYNLIWKDALGSWISYPFKYVATEGTEVTRSNYYRREGEFKVGGEDDWTFEIDNINRGETTYNTQSRNKFQLTSGWVKDHENILFEDLIKSAEVYLQLPSKVYGTQMPGEYLVDEFGDYITDEFGNYIIVGSSGYFEYTYTMNELVPVVLETSNIEYGKSKNFQIYNYSPLVRVAYNDYRFA